MTKEELKRARKRLGMTQGELAGALGMQNNSISRMEIGAQSIMRTTELSVKYLLLTMSKKRRGKK
jgi:transcriptional regulator with XRE-family HTH domain